MATKTRTLPLLPLRDVVVFPGTPVPLIVGRPRSVAAIRAAKAGDGEILLVAQRRGDVAYPDHEDLLPVGTIATVSQALEHMTGLSKLALANSEAVRHMCAKLMRFLSEREQLQQFLTDLGT